MNPNAYKGKRNPVAKNDFNKGGAHADKTKYKRKPKHKSVS